MLRARLHFLLVCAYNSLSLFTDQRERDKERKREGERERMRKRKRERERVTGALAPFLVI